MVSGRSQLLCRNTGGETRRLETSILLCLESRTSSCSLGGSGGRDQQAVLHGGSALTLQSRYNLRECLYGQIPLCSSWRSPGQCQRFDFYLNISWHRLSESRNIRSSILCGQQSRLAHSNVWSWPVAVCVDPEGVLALRTSMFMKLSVSFSRVERMRCQCFFQKQRFWEQQRSSRPV